MNVFSLLFKKVGKMDKNVRARSNGKKTVNKNIKVFFFMISL